LIKRWPYRESGYRHLMRALTAEGNTAEALRLQELRALLREELGIAPSAETLALHACLLGQRAPA
jgi:SARP family transcriptional regulator, regulator of embCAB operon